MTTAAIDSILREQGFMPEATVLRFPDSAREHSSQLTYATLRGRLCEWSAEQGAGLYTVAAHMIRQAQIAGEWCVWIVSDKLPFAPDLYRGGIDLQSLVVVQVATIEQQIQVADTVLRSGAFGLVILDEVAEIRFGMQGRLVQLAQKSQATVMLMSRKTTGMPSAGSLVSWHGYVEIVEREDRYGDCSLDICVEVVKDKIAGPGWTSVLGTWTLDD